MDWLLSIFCRRLFFRSTKCGYGPKIDVHTNITKTIDITSLSMTPQYAAPESSPDTSTVVRNDALQKFSPFLLILLRMQFYVIFGDKLTFMLKIASDHYSNLDCR
ncbi:no significant blast hit [Histoplasma capsulatum G186AR]|uniref:Uncharacterized protein n=1 Tax=Ajellomyces capsulatus TaxID=5037 RepID=A0A8H7Y9M8_AJECA|nr:hypothetical protein I7I52_11068 [Histoplasma capsulatum]QSS70856.1 no significant blast hit [Histoplasma capsulatum G186AR]